MGLDLTRSSSSSSNGEDVFSVEESLNELSELAGTAGLEVCGSVTQRLPQRDPRTFIGRGKVNAVRAELKRLKCCTVILDDELSPGQQRQLEAAFNGGRRDGKVKVVDRTALILDIFAQHARTKEGQLQVELALHEYRLPRLSKMWSHLERQGAGIGTKGLGETQIEVDRRQTRAKIVSLNKQLQDVGKHRALHRTRRQSLGSPLVALVGYTNAGKSTLLNALSAKSGDIFADNMLFATLDPTTRKVKLGEAGSSVSSEGSEAAADTEVKAASSAKALTSTAAAAAAAADSAPLLSTEVLFTDTVGFIQKLPTHLVAAFRATLEELEAADVLVHVVDVSNPRLWRKQKQAVDRTLEELGFGDKPTVVLWNKADAVKYVSPARLAKEANRRPLTVAASAKTGQGLNQLSRLVENAIATALLEPVEAFVPYAAATDSASSSVAAAYTASKRGSESSTESPMELVQLAYSTGAVTTLVYEPEGCRLAAQVPRSLAGRLGPYRTDGGGNFGRDDDDDEEDWVAIAKKRKGYAVSAGAGESSRGA